MLANPQARCLFPSISSKGKVIHCLCPTSLLLPRAMFTLLAFPNSMRQFAEKLIIIGFIVSVIV